MRNIDFRNLKKFHISFKCSDYFSAVDKEDAIEALYDKLQYGDISLDNIDIIEVEEAED